MSREDDPTRVDDRLPFIHHAVSDVNSTAVSMNNRKKKTLSYIHHPALQPRAVHLTSLTSISEPLSVLPFVSSLLLPPFARIHTSDTARPLGSRALHRKTRGTDGRCD